MNFITPARCSTASVNQALAAAGIAAYIQRDPYDNHNYSVVFEHGDHTMSQRTGMSTARAAANFVSML